MRTGNQDPTAGEPSVPPNVSPELQDAIRSIDAIGENAWGKDDDEDAPRPGGSARPETESAEADPLQDSPEGESDAP